MNLTKISLAIILPTNRPIEPMSECLTLRRRRTKGNALVPALRYAEQPNRELKEEKKKTKVSAKDREEKEEEERVIMAPARKSYP